MSMEIKFRAKDYTTGEFRYGYFTERGFESESGYVIIDYDMPNIFYRVDEKTVGQFIGIKNIYGREIYDGDICKSSDGEIGVIEFDIERLQFIRNCKDDSDEIRYYNFYEFEVISNIYENPELIK